MNLHIRKTDWTQKNSLTLNLKILEKKKKKTSPKLKKREEITDIKGKINATKIKKQYKASMNQNVDSLKQQIKSINH